MTGPTRFSYFFIVGVIVLAGATHLATPLVTVLFAHFALRKLNSFCRRKWLSIGLFIVLCAAVLYGIGFLVRQAWIALPTIAAESIPPAIAYAENHGIELPFSDLEGLKTATFDVVKDEFL